MNIKFSIIIATYNTGKYVINSINSVLNQTYNQYEIIVIDDGSTDDTLEIIKKEYSNEKKITIIEKKHTGVSETRNIGLEKATGDWITFLDSDDWLDKNCLYEINKLIEDNNGLNAIISNLTINEKEREYQRYKLTEAVIENKEKLIETTIAIEYGKNRYGDLYGNCRCIGGKFYKTEIIKQNKIKFPEEIFVFEDGIFNLHFYKNSNKILTTNTSWYHYRQVQTSSTHKISINRREQNDRIIKLILEYKDSVKLELDECLNYGVFELLKVSFYKEIERNDFNNLLEEKKSRKKYLKKINILKNYLNKKDIVLLMLFKTNSLTFYIGYQLIKILKKIKRKIKGENK